MADLAKPGLIVVLCATEAPCGKYADQVLAKNNVTLTPKSRELDAKATLTKVASGDADAAIVYVTDVKGAKGNVDGVEIPDGQNVIATLPIAALKDAKNAALAEGMGRVRDIERPREGAAGAVRLPRAVTAPAVGGSGPRRAPPAVVVAIAVVGLVIFFVAAARRSRPARAVVELLVGSLRSRVAHRAPALARMLAGRRPRCRCCSASRSPGCSPASSSRGSRSSRALAMLPLVLPPVVGGVALLVAFGRRGLVGQ